MMMAYFALDGQNMSFLLVRRRPETKCGKAKNKSEYLQVLASEICPAISIHAQCQKKIYEMMRI